MIPQLIIIGLGLIGFGISLANHGKKKEKEENAIVTIVSIVISWSILYWGGFFDVLLK